MERQIGYAQTLRNMWAGSQMTIIVLTKRSAGRPFHRKGLLLIPLSGGALTSRMRLVPMLLGLHRRHPIDVMTTQTVADEGLLVLLLGKLVGLRVIGQIHWDLFSDAARRMALGSGLQGRVRRALALCGLRHFFALRVVGTKIEREVFARGLHSNTHVIPVPVECSDPPRPIPPKRTSEPLHILFVGRLAEEKNLEGWFKVAKEVAAVREHVIFDVVGDGKLRDRLEALSRELGLEQRVRFHGWVRHEELSAFYASAAVLLLTSWYEGFGRVLIEAYCHRLPCVSSRVTGPDDIIQDGITGFLHPPEDTAAIVQSVIRLIDDKALRERMGSNGQRLVASKFEPRHLAEQWVRLLVDSARRHLPQMLPPRTRTWMRYGKLCRSSLTLLRSLQYEAIDGLHLYGTTLDIGGGARNSYWHLLRVEGLLMSVNLNPSVVPSVIVDLNRGLPFSDASFDNVVSLNTYEHIYRDETAIRESLRVLRIGGRFHFIVPFLYQIHGSPSDFHRHTPDWWVAVLRGCGVSPSRYWIDSLVWDRLNSAASFFGHGARLPLIRRLLLIRGCIRDALWPLDRRPFDREAESDLKVPVGLHIFGTKG
ncbi:MAG: glycosyltransferase [Pseudomonadota bacterium]